MNLKSGYGQTYRIAREEGSEPRDPAGFIMPCRRGHIYVHGRELLGAFIGRGPTARKLAALPGVKLHTDGDDGITITFAPERFAAVATLIRPKRKRQLSAEQKAALIARLSARRRPAESGSRVLASDRIPADDQTAVLAA